MYSTKYSDDRRYVITCIINHSSVDLVDAIFDTGARYTCYTAKCIPKLKENQLRHNEYKYFGGFIEGSAVKFYKYTVKQYIIGNIDMGTRDIWVTFNEKVTDCIIGMDILQDICFVQYANEKTLNLFRTKEEMNIFINSKHDIKRKVYKDGKGWYIMLYNMKCYIDNKFIKQDTVGRYVELDRQKCYLIY